VRWQIANPVRIKQLGDELKVARQIHKGGGRILKIPWIRQAV